MTDTAVGAKPGRPAQVPAPPRPVRYALIFGIVGLPLFMMSVDSTVVATALPALQQGLGTTVNWAGWTLTAYSLGVAVMLPLSGKLSERFGRRRVFVASVATFTAASLLCGLVDNIFVLIALRALQAAGGAGFTPSATGIIVDHFGPARDRAVSLFGAIYPVGAMIGPAVGGLFVTYWSWRGVFLINLPVGIAVVLLALRFIPPDPPQPRGAALQLDVPGAVLLGAGILCAMLAASTLGEKDTPALAPAVLVPAALALALLGAFLHHINRVQLPFIAPRFIHGRHFGAVNLINVLFGGAATGASALIPLYAASRYGFGALDGGALLIVEGAATLPASILAALLLRRSGYRPPLYAGGAAIAVGTLMLALAPPADLAPFFWLGAASVLIGLGSGIINPASRNAGLQLAPQNSSVLAALRSLFLQLGAIISVGVITAVMAGAAAPAMAQAWAYAVLALVVALALPLVMRVPEYRGAW